MQLPNETRHQGQVLMAYCPGQTPLGAFSVPTDTHFLKCCSSSNQIKNVPVSWGPTGCWPASTSLSVISMLQPCLETSEMTAFNFPLGEGAFSADRIYSQQEDKNWHQPWPLGSV